MTRAPEGDPEVERIRAEYERRRREIPEDFYALHKRANLFLRHGQERALRDGLDRAGWLPLGERRVLEVGCGEGAWLGIFERLGAVPEALAGIELDPERAAVCRQKHPAATIEVGDAGQLPWPDASFDLVFQSTLFTSILDAGTRQRVAAEMYEAGKLVTAACHGTGALLNAQVDGGYLTPLGQDAAQQAQTLLRVLSYEDH